MASVSPFFILKQRNSVKDHDGQAYKFKRPLLKPMAEINDFFKSRVIQDMALAEEPDGGQYTWILLGGVLYVTKVVSGQEIGSLHANLFAWAGSDPSALQAAGELMKSGEDIQYNFHSGTYMEKVIKSREIRNGLIEALNAKIRSLGLNPVFLKCDDEADGIVHCTEAYEAYSGKAIINNKSILTTPEEIEIYKSFFTLNQGGAGLRRTRRRRCRRRGQ